MDFLPVTREETDRLGWDAPDIVLVSGDAYVDHPSFGAALIGRVLEARGYRVAVLAQPDYRSEADFTRFGRPKLCFMVSAGNIDSMVNGYTAAKRRRSEDAYTPGGQAGKRPERATIVYCNRIRQAYGKVPVVIGGVEASLRRFSHADYWSGEVKRSILLDSGADLLIYGMGERTSVLVADALAETGGLPRDLPGTSGVLPADQAPDGLALPSHEEVASDKRAYARAFMTESREQDPVRGKRLLQACAGRVVVHNPPALPLSRDELDAVYSLHFARAAHPNDAGLGVPAIEEVRFSLAATRGCFGGCSFCALNFHQGRIVQSRSPESLVGEAKLLTRLDGFKGYIHDVGGPTANFRAPACGDQLSRGACADRQCLFPRPCKRLRVDHRELVGLLRRLRALPGVKKVFIRSGIRFDYLMLDPNREFARDLVEHHVSGQLKVAPEHVAAGALDAMGKPPREVFEAFLACYARENKRLGKKQYLVPYFISGHPGTTLEDAVELALFMKRHRIMPEQVQDFYPTPGTLSTAMWWTGLDLRAMKPIHVPGEDEKAMQRALLQYARPKNHALVRKALRAVGREDLIGRGEQCLVPHASQGRGGRAGGLRPPRPRKGNDSP